jgi:hypothetical protein
MNLRWNVSEDSIASSTTRERAAKVDRLPKLQSKVLIDQLRFCFAAPSWESSMLSRT